MGKIVCGYEMERLLGPKRECFPSSSRAARINSNFPTSVPTIPLGEGAKLFLTETFSCLLGDLGGSLCYRN